MALRFRSPSPPQLPQLRRWQPGSAAASRSSTGNNAAMTAPQSATPEITDNASESRFETTLDGQQAELIYRRVGKRLVLVHTRVPGELAGHGIGGELVQAAVRK